MRRPLPLATVLLALLLVPACGEAPGGRGVEPHPQALVGRYAAKAHHFLREVRDMMRYDLAPALERADEAGVAELERRLQAASRAWAEALANELDLRADGTLTWRLLEAVSSPDAAGTWLVDLPPPSVPAAYDGTWRQVAPGTIEVEFTNRNGRPLRWPATSTCRVRADGALVLEWSRDLDVSIDEQPLVPTER